MRYRLHKRSKRLKRQWCCLLFAVLFLLCWLFVYLDGALRPLVQSYGYQSARRSGMLAIHQGMGELLASESTAYQELISIQRDDNGHIISAEANVPAINLLKSRATAEAIRWLQQNENQVIRIPLGSLIGGSFFTGRGPFLPLNIHTSGSVITTLSGQFVEAGVNQTCHRLYLSMTVLMTVALPGERQSVELKTDFLIGETVIVGEVPETYAQIALDDPAPFTETFGGK